MIPNSPLLCLFMPDSLVMLCVELWIHRQVFRAVAIASPSSSVSRIRRCRCARGGEAGRPGHPLHTPAKESSQKHLWAHSRLFFSRREPLLPQGIVPPPAPAKRQHLGLSWMTGPAVAFPPPIWRSCLAPHPCPAPLGGQGQQSGCAEVTLSSGLTQGSHRRADQPAQGCQMTTSIAAGLVGPHQAPCSGGSLKCAQFLSPGAQFWGLRSPETLCELTAHRPPCCWGAQGHCWLATFPPSSILFLPVLL